MNSALPVDGPLRRAVPLASSLLWLAICAGAHAQPSASDCAVGVAVKPSTVVQDLQQTIVFEVTNIGTVNCTLPKDLQPEGWIVRFAVHSLAGGLIYESPVTKLELTRARIDNMISIPPGTTHSAAFEIPRLPAGHYRVSGSLSTQHLKNLKVAGLAIGTWQAPVVPLDIPPQ